MVTVDAARALGRPDLGALAPGMAADIITVDPAFDGIENIPMRGFRWHAG